MRAEVREALAAKLDETAAAVDAALTNYVPQFSGPAAHVTQAMLHSLRGGKRIRPFLVRLSAETFGLGAEAVMPTACAYELLHTATLIHDDLPAIDNADLRRGQPSCHVAFDEPTAILAGDALIVAAFGALAAQAKEPLTPPELAVRVLREFADAVSAVI
ncbi:MAG: polyprenyl synthetase family protein, partial [Armatimonadetes bacterium]|nr:polyprenyl synthetase family protein [Armatimonadota bacterium]